MAQKESLDVTEQTQLSLVNRNMKTLLGCR